MAGTTVDAFNGTLKSFLQELVECYPAAPGVGKLSLFLSGFDMAVRANPRVALDAFVEAMAPHTTLIATKDAALFERAALPGGFDLGGLWAEADEDAREKVWQYVQMLHMLGSTASMMSPDMLASLETMAQQCAGKIQNGEMDMAAMTAMLMNGGLETIMDGGPPALKKPRKNK